MASSVVVGAVATAVDWLVLVASVLLGVNERVAIVPAFLAGVAVQFFGNRRYAFRAHGSENRAKLGTQARHFALVEFGAFALNTVAYNALLGFGMDFKIARVVASAAVYLGFSYPMWHRVFREEGSP